jgi:hypothetical protein
MDVRQANVPRETNEPALWSQSRCKSEGNIAAREAFFS